MMQYLKKLYFYGPVLFLFILPISLKADLSQKARQPETLNLQTVCKKFRGKHVGYYSKFYEVNQNCQKLELQAKEVYKRQRAGVVFVDITGAEMLHLPVGPAQNLSSALDDLHGFCKKNKQTYLTVGYVKYYWIHQDCSIQEFPDWATYEAHRGDLDNPTRLTVVSGKVRSALKKRSSYDSILDKEFAKLTDNYAIDLLPITEACRGLVGKTVTYLDSIYKIQPRIPIGCEKVKIDAEKYTFNHKNMNLNELTSSQAHSIPSATIN